MKLKDSEVGEVTLGSQCKPGPHEQRTGETAAGELAAVARHGGEGPAPPTPSSWICEARVGGLSVRQRVVVLVTKFRVICRAADRKPTQGLKCQSCPSPRAAPTGSQQRAAATHK